MTIENKLRELVGQKVISFKLTAWGDLLLYIGTPSVESELAEWYLHIESAWRLDKNRTPVLGSLDCCVDIEKDNAKSLLAPLEEIIGCRVESFSLGDIAKNISLTLSGGYRLATFSHSLDGDDWRLYRCNGEAIGMEESDITKVREWKYERNKKPNHGLESTGAPPAAGTPETHP